MLKSMIAITLTAGAIVAGVSVHEQLVSSSGITNSALHSARDGRTDPTHGRYHVIRR